MKHYIQQGLHGISSDTRLKLKVLSFVLDKPIVRLVELMTDRLWEEKQDYLSRISQTRVNQEARKILKGMIPR